MRHRLVFVIAAVAIFAGLAVADEKPGATTHKISRTADGHPDLSGLWGYTIDLPPVLLKTQINGATSLKSIDRSARELGKGNVAGALPWTPGPTYKPEFFRKEEALSDNESTMGTAF